VLGGQIAITARRRARSVDDDPVALAIRHGNRRPILGVGVEQSTFTVFGEIEQVAETDYHYRQQLRELDRINRCSCRSLELTTNSESNFLSPRLKSRRNIGQALSNTACQLGSRFMSMTIRRDCSAPSI
jgi:hypothetical protein